MNIVLGLCVPIAVGVIAWLLPFFIEWVVGDLGVEREVTI